VNNSTKIGYELTIF